MSAMSGRLIYVMGPSGSGKDSLLRLARETLTQRPQGLAGVCFAHRYITRAADAGGENHIALSPAEFQARQAAGLFALHWHSHGLDYGIGIEVEQWLTRGLTVVMNGSREHLPLARSRFAALLPVCISVSPEVQRQRLLERGREDQDAIAARLARQVDAEGLSDQGTVHIRNDGTLQEATAQLLRLIEADTAQATGEVACA